MRKVEKFANEKLVNFKRLGRFTSTQEFLNEMFKAYKKLTLDELQYLKDIGSIYENQYTSVWYIKNASLPFLLTKIAR